MRARDLTILSTIALSILALVAAGCGSSDSSSSSTAATTASTSTSASSGKSGKAVTIDVADNPDLGQILTDGDGNTVYLFEKDDGNESYCTSSECVAAWPPVTTSGDVTAGAGADQSLIGTVQREDGTEQVTYDGHPLYLYAGDSKPGDTTGNGLDQFGAEWYALTPDGSNAEGTSSGGSTSTESTTTNSGSVY